jgi:transposase InsO family protein
MDLFHNKMGHPGRDRTTSLVTDRFYWSKMRSNIQTWVEECHRCTKFKTPTNQRAKLVNIQTSFPVELVCMDYLTLEPCKGGVQNILVMTDHFTKFAVGVPTRNQTAKTTADAFFHNIVIPYKLPKPIHSDQGTNFMSKLLQDLCSLTGISNSRTTPYHTLGTASLKGSTGHLFLCWEHFNLTRKQTGKCKSDL